MIGILLVSHGEMAKGMHNSAKMFFSDEIESFDYLCFKEEMVIDDFDNQINKKLKELNDGSGVVILADIVGGTPCNRIVSYLKEDIYLICGFNFNLLIDLLVNRNNYSQVCDLNVLKMMDEAKNSIVFVNKLLEEM